MTTKLRTCIQCGQNANHVIINPGRGLCTSCIATNQLKERYGYIMEDSL